MKTKNYNWFWYSLLIFFLVFLAYYIAYSSGYYEVKLSKRSIITQERLEEFENDVKNNKEIDIKNYTNKDDVDYSSMMSKIGNTLANGIDSFMEGGMSDFFNFLGKMFT